MALAGDSDLFAYGNGEIQHKIIRILKGTWNSKKRESAYLTNNKL